MPGIPFTRLIADFLIDIERLGANVVELTPRQIRPHRLVVSTPGRSDVFELYLWTVTPGGPKGVRPTDEWRIQITNATKFTLQAGVRVVVGGWNPEHDVYVFWDARRHSQFSEKSPGFHVKSAALALASHHGVGTHIYEAREGREVVVCVTRPYLLWYLQDGMSLHDLDQDAAAVPTLVTASPEVERGFAESAVSEAEFLRRHQLIEVMRAYRAARFRPDVLKAYRYRCAVCQIALKLIEAAHIVPVQHPLGVDVVTNGLALCRLHHAAFDNSLLGIRPDYRVVMNAQQVDRLRDAGLIFGLEEFRAALPDAIHIPASIEVRPEPDRLRLGMEVRGWSRSYLA